MQYILSEEEFKSLESADYYFKLSESVNTTFYNLAKAFCPRIHNGKKYCDDCAFLKEFIREKHSKKRACPLSIERSK